MAKIELKVAEPSAFERGANEPPAQMVYGDTGAAVVIDTDSAYVECEAQGKSAPINQWAVDFEGHKMMLAGEVQDGNYRKIDFPTAVGMVGQLVMAVGQSTLMTLLTTIREVVYKMNDGSEPQPSANDVSKKNESGEDGSQDSSAEPDLPTSVDPDEL